MTEIKENIDTQIPEEVLVVLAFGSNIGNRRKNIKRAINLLHESNLLNSTKISSFYETEPVGVQNQDWYLNTALTGKTTMPLYNLMELCKSIEYSIGRKSRERWAPREIDIDIIFYGYTQFETANLTVPHKRMHERKFVLQPIAEIAGTLLHPKLNKTINQLLEECPDKSEVRKII